MRPDRVRPGRFRRTPERLPCGRIDRCFLRTDPAGHQQAAGRRPRSGSSPHGGARNGSQGKHGHRRRGQERIHVGSPVANRSRVETEELIGMFVNTLVFRLRLSGEESFLAISRGELNPTTAYMTGKLKIKGDMGAAMKLQKLF